MLERRLGRCPCTAGAPDLCGCLSQHRPAIQKRAWFGRVGDKPARWPWCRRPDLPLSGRISATSFSESDSIERSQAARSRLVGPTGTRRANRAGCRGQGRLPAVRLTFSPTTALRLFRPDRQKTLPTPSCSAAVPPAGQPAAPESMQATIRDWDDPERHRHGVRSNAIAVHSIHLLRGWIGYGAD